MIEIKCLIYVFLIFYAKSFFDEVIKYLRIIKGLHKISRFARNFETARAYQPRSFRYEVARRNLLRYAPVIENFVHAPTLSHRNHDYTNYQNALDIHKTLLDVLDRQYHAIIASLNPAHTLKDIVLFPVTILTWLGIRPKKVTASILTTVGWIAAYLLNAFQSEIKNLLVILLEQLIST